jgi:hypothetical protein
MRITNTPEMKLALAKLARLIRQADLAVKSVREARSDDPLRAAVESCWESLSLSSAALQEYERLLLAAARIAAGPRGGAA